MGYLSYIIGFLTCIRNPDEGQCQAGSLTGAVASKRVTEALEGLLRMIGNHSKSVKAKGLDCEADGPSRYESRT